MMDLKELKRLIEMVQKTDLAEFEYTEGDIKIRIVRGVPQTFHVPVTPQAFLPSPAGNQPSGKPASAESPAISGNAPAAEIVEDVSITTINSPMVGTFYRSPAPDAAPFVDIGNTVETDQTVCIVEAMKLMNEIKSEFRCKIIEVLVENGHTVEFGQPLFKVQKL
jgi:acetyl-CoA carboxylase biotin carboxyl carrier protein